MPAVLRQPELIDRIGRFIADREADSFTALARELCRYQAATMPALAAYWKSCGFRPDAVDDPAAIPPVSLRVFKHQLLYGGPEPARTFRTSGTSGKGRGAAPFDQAGLELMDSSILTNASAQLCSDGLKSRFFMLVPSPDEAPEVIMAHGMRTIARHFGLGEPFYAVQGGCFVGPSAVEWLKGCIGDNIPVTLIGGSFGFVNFVEGLQGKLDGLPLAAGSRMLDAGGFKGRSRELDRHEFLALMQSFFQLPAERCFNLYGLTELASQFYSRGAGPKKPPHWTRVRVCEPLSLREVTPGESGVPVLYDLANVDRPFVILTDDIAGSHGEAGFELVGRASGAAPRGCSLSLEEVR